MLFVQFPGQTPTFDGIVKVFPTKIRKVLRLEKKLFQKRQIKQKLII